MKLKNHFYKVDKPSLKLDHYFDVYQELLEPFRNKLITLVEVGVLNGGSLEMWKSFLGKKVRVIGIDSNPAAKAFETKDIEICIFDQEQDKDWELFFRDVGKIEIIIDDGGHTAVGQVLTVIKSIDFVRDGGYIIIEDVHSSYNKDFGTPHKYSFDNWVMAVEKCLNKEYNNCHHTYPQYIGKVVTRIKRIVRFRSMIIFEITEQNYTCRSVTNSSTDSAASNVEDFRYHSRGALFNYFYGLSNNEFRWTFKRSKVHHDILRRIFLIIHILLNRIKFRFFEYYLSKLVLKTFYFPYFRKMRRYFL